MKSLLLPPLNLVGKLFIASLVFRTGNEIGNGVKPVQPLVAPTFESAPTTPRAKPVPPAALRFRGRMHALLLGSLTCALCCSTVSAADYQAGVARRLITPPLPFWMSGYAARTNPATRVRTDLWAKALALQDDQGNRAVFITTDLIGLPREVSEEVATRLHQSHHLPRANLLLNSSHTHCGPVVGSNLRVMFDFDAAEKDRALKYTGRLADDLTAIATEALARLAPARLAFGRDTTDFAMNRRAPAAGGAFRLGENPAGPVDHGVPVLRVSAPDGQLRAVLFGYACHNTTLALPAEIDGDYAGAAQRTLEKAHPGVTALFLMLCGGDQNPRPRGTVELAEQHGCSLAAAVERALAADLKPVRPPIRAAWETLHLDFAPHTRETFETELKSDHVFKQRRARLMLEAYDRGAPVRQTPFPVQVVRLGNDLTWLALGGEVVVDYAHRARREFPDEDLVVAGYCNDVMCYIPSLRVLREGSYESVDSMIYYAQPGPLAENVEETVFRGIRAAMSRAGARAGAENRPAPAPQ